MPQDRVLRRMLGRDCQPLIMDGGMGTTIEDRGIDVRSAVWGSYCFVDGPSRQVNDQIHADFVDAGARILVANTHNVRLAKCAEFLENQDLPGLPKHIAETHQSERPGFLHRWLHEQAVDSAQKAIPANAEIVVASCLGSVEPLGPYAQESQITSQEAYRRLIPELRVRRHSGVDLIIFETLTTRSELEGVALLAREHDIGDFAVGLTCRSGGDTLAQISMAEVVDILADARPLIYFVQCTRYDYVKAALEQLKSEVEASDVVGVYANDGRVWKDRGWQGERISPKVYGEHATTWQQMGARVIGGCCGTGPDHIVELATTLGRHRN